MHDAHEWLRGRELKLLAALGISWKPGVRQHIRCPFPDHDDKHPSWRWDDPKRRWFCTCGDGTAYDAVMRIHGCDFAAAYKIAREKLGEATSANSLTQGKPAVNAKLATPEIKYAYADKPPAPSDLVAKVKRGNEWCSLGAPAEDSIWIYPDPEHGNKIAFVVARYDGPAVQELLQKAKEYRPWIWDGTRWVSKFPPGPRPLYRAPELASDDTAPVLVVEGEKAVKKAEWLFPEYVTVTSSSGSESAHLSKWGALRGRRVIIWPDHDYPKARPNGTTYVPSEIYAQSVARLAHEAGAPLISIVDVPADWPDGWDLGDECPSDSIDLRDMLDAAVPWYPAAPAAPADALAPALELPPIQEAPAAAAKTFRFPMLSLAEIKPSLTGNWLIKGILPSKGLAIIYGGSGAGKSFLALHAALHIAAARPWAAKKTYQTGVIYIAAEGQQGFPRRVAAARDKLGIPDGIPFRLILVPPNLGTLKGDAAILIEEIKMQSAIFGIRPGAVFIDTLAQTMFGADESGSEGMGAFIANCGLISRDLDVLSAGIHHIGKDATLGMRGWSGLRAACDAAWEVSKSDTKRSVRLEKNKEGEEDISWDFLLEKIEIGRDEDGDPVTTCVAVVDDIAPTVLAEKKSKGRKPLSGQKADVLESIKWALEEFGVPMQGIGRQPAGVKGVLKEKVKIILEKRGFFDGKNLASGRAAMSRTISGLSGDRFVGHWDKWVWMI